MRKLHRQSDEQRSAAGEMTSFDPAAASLGPQPQRDVDLRDLYAEERAEEKYIVEPLVVHEPRGSHDDNEGQIWLRHDRRRRLLLLFGPTVVVIGALYFYFSGGRYVSTDNAYVKASEMTVTTDIVGTVVEIDVTDNEKVERGQVLFRLDDEPYRIALTEAEAALGTIVNEIMTLRATYQQNLAEIEQVKSDVAYNEANYQRQLDLEARNVASQAALDQAQRDLDGAREHLAWAQRQAEATLAQLGGAIDGDINDHPRIRQAQGQIDRAQRDLNHTVVTAAMSGIVTKVESLQVGEYLQTAEPAFTLVATDDVWIEASPKETDLTNLAVGNPTTVTIDAYPNRVWQAKVASISPASGSEFSVLPAVNASGNWVKVVQRVPVRLSLVVPTDAPRLRAGMSVVVKIDTGHRRSVGDLFRTLGHWIGF